MISPKSFFGLRLACVIPAFLACFVPAASYASSFTYTYTGNPFTNADSNPQINQIIASFTVTSLIPANYDGAISPVDWSMSDGFYTLTPSNGVLAALTNEQTAGLLDIATDDMGDIVRWNMFAASPPYIIPATGSWSFAQTEALCAVYPEPCVAMLTYDEFSSVYGSPLYPEDSDSSIAYGYDNNFGPAGSWTCSPDCSQSTPQPQSAPEPHTLVMIGFGAAMMATIRRSSRCRST